jgi:signal transduction histidine kinase/DNA-binding response OmpR family regulator
METPLQLLLVDDDEVDRRTVRRSLEGAGLPFELTELTDPTATREAMARQRFDCILLDYRLPKTDGLDVLRAVRNSGFEAPVIMLTGQGDEQLAVELMKAGAADYLSKSTLGPDLARSIASAVELHRAREAVRDVQLQNAALRRIGTAISANLDLHDIVQKVTDEATSLCRAAFGAFFYNVADPERGSYMLYALSGVSRDHFDKFPMPRVTAIFGPTFRGECIMRSDDITKDPRYGKSAPYYGMPEGHLPVRSYLAVSVVSRSGEVHGGLFFGHANPGVFGERDERMLEAVAGQAALAIDNAQLYQASQRARAEAEIDRDRYRAAMLATKEAERSLELLANTGKVAVSTSDPSAMLEAVARVFVPGYADWCSIVLRDDAGRLNLAACASSDPSIAAVIRSFTARHPLRPTTTAGSPQVARSGSPHLMSEVTEADLRAMANDDDDALQELRGLELRSALVVPLMAQGRVLGTLSLCSRSPERRFSAADIPLVEEVGLRTAAAIESSRLYVVAQQERQRAEEANRAKDEFLAVVSHEIRNPLNAIMGWANVLLTGSLGPEQTKRAIATIERNAKAQAQLIEDLLDVSRIVTGKMRIEVGPVEIVRVVENALDVVRHAADAKGVRLQPILDRGAGPLMGDADRLQQVVWNLLSNAVKFTGKGGRVVIRLQRIDSSVMIIVEDTGEGIDPLFLPHVFDRFRQADMATTRTKQGLGLGLAIVRHIAELHGGSIDAFSEGQGKGSTFTLRLPVSPLRSTGIHAAGTPLVMSRTSTIPEPFQCPPEIEGLRILVVDDEPDARELLVSMLSHCKASVLAASSAKEALAMLHSERPDLLVSDIGMPEVDGYELIREVRALPADAGALTPAIALTAYARAEDRTKALLSGFNMHVSKPIEPAELLAAIAGVAGRHRSR